MQHILIKHLSRPQEYMYTKVLWAEGTYLLSGPGKNLCAEQSLRLQLAADPVPLQGTHMVIVHFPQLQFALIF